MLMKIYLYEIFMIIFNIIEIINAKYIYNKYIYYKMFVNLIEDFNFY